MPKPNWVDHKKTRDYIPIVSTEYTSHLSQKFQRFEKRAIHEGRVVHLDFEDFQFQLINIVYIIELQMSL